MTPKLVKWCAHPSRHKDCVKVGRSITHPKGKRVIKKRLAQYICFRYRRVIGGKKTVIKPSDYLCNTCYNFEYDYMVKKYGVIEPKQRVSDEEVDDTINNNDFIGSVDSNEESFEEASEEISYTSTPDMKEDAYSRMEAQKVVNEVFHLLKIEPIDDV
jgi:hypothetical protein